MLANLAIFLVSLVFLLLSADRLIDVVVTFAKGLRISAMVVGLTVVAIGTSLPEVMASSAAAFRGYPDIAIGNVVGSNICNVGLILGLPALFFPIVCSRTVILREGSLMLLATAMLWALGVFLGGMSRIAAGVFFLGFCWFIYSVFHSESGCEESDTGESSVDDAPGESSTDEAGSTAVLILKLLAYLAALLISSEFLVRSTVELARAVGIAEGVIAISIIALGTSLPELSVSIAAAKKNQGDILIGNILGSNISNIFLVLGVSGLILPFPISGLTLSLDIPLMALLAGLMFYFLYQERGINRSRGIVLLLLYGVMITRCILFSDVS